MLRFRLQPILCRIVILECSVGKGAPWGMVLVANPSQPRVITSLFPPREDQRLLRVPEWGILSVRHSQCENAPLVLSSLYLPAGQFNHHKAKSGAVQGWEDQRCSPYNRLRPFRIRVHPFKKISQWAIRWFQGLLTFIWAIDSLTFPSMPFFCLEHVPRNLKQRSFRLSTQSLNSA